MAFKTGRSHTTAPNRHDRESGPWLTLLAVCSPLTAFMLALSRPVLDPDYRRRRRLRAQSALPSTPSTGTLHTRAGSVTEQRLHRRARRISRKRAQLRRRSDFSLWRVLLALCLPGQIIAALVVREFLRSGPRRRR